MILLLSLRTHTLDIVYVGFFFFFFWTYRNSEFSQLRLNTSRCIWYDLLVSF